MVVRMVRIEPNRGNGRGSLARLGSASSFRSLSCRQLPSWFLISFRFHNCCLWLALISATSSTTRAWSRALVPATTTRPLATAATVCPKTPSSCWRTTRTCPRWFTRPSSTSRSSLAARLRTIWRSPSPRPARRGRVQLLERQSIRRSRQATHARPVQEGLAQTGSLFGTPLD